MHVKKLLIALGICAMLPVSQAHAYEVNRSFDQDRTGIAVYHPDGRWSGTSDALEPRPALSLAKIYLAYYVLYNGSAEERGLVRDMIRHSSDDKAQQLDNAYPEAIGQIADDFNLNDTSRNGAWGRTTTSPYDMSRFIASILWDPKARPLFDAMEDVADTAADGFRQEFGTAKLDRVTGFKTGWSDDQISATGSVAYGKIGDEVWVATALTNGDAFDNTADAIRGIDQIEEERVRPSRVAALKAWKRGDPIPFPLKRNDR
ncbi:hypothetical protein [Corynebacterium sp. LK2510]|uniref:hypothetical protein n=1 Tax=Corynebacterium sp. LK2510 TaxID=3110472 RepID=UPI0034CEDB8B